ncbi:MAG: branched-chain amino acid aminotransferase, partial [Oscillospiraceae bacterium]
MNITIEKTKTPKQKPDMKNLPFGHFFSDHMFVMDYEVEKGWFDARIVPYAPIELEPSAMVFHYAQEVFEGLKAYKSATGNVRLFRPEKNFERLNISNERMAIPQVDEAFCVEALKQLVEIEKDWIPEQEGASLYIRPFIIATDPYLGVRPSNSYKLMIICSPSGLYYPEGLAPVRIYVEDEYVRAVRGGTGFTKTGGNYAGSIRAQVVAHEKGYSQVLWLDGVEQKYIEEVGSMNIFFKIDGQVVTPALNGSILGGITRMSAIELLKKWNIPVVEKRLSIQEVADAYKDGKLEEC